MKMADVVGLYWNFVGLTGGSAVSGEDRGRELAHVLILSICDDEVVPSATFAEEQQPPQQQQSSIRPTPFPPRKCGHK